MWRVFAPVVLGLSGALYLGLIDYETTSVWRLFEGENLPFVIFLAFAIGAIVMGFQELAWQAWRGLSQRRT